MKRTTFALVGSLLVGASSFALAQVTPPRPNVPTVEQPNQVQTEKLIGTNIKNAQNETVGEVKSVALGQDGKAEAVIVSVGGFLGVGEREVAIAWKDLTIADGGNVVTIKMTKDQLAALPEYKYLNTADRGTVFRSTPADRPPMTAQRPADLPLRADAPRPADPPRVATPSRTADATTLPSGFMSASKLVGLNVYDTENKSIGEIKDVVLSGRGEVQTAILNVGGVLGIGSKDVGLSWNEIQFRTDGDTLKATVAMSLDQLKALPEYRTERGAWVLKN
jgi:sporulation protein YlmC with PRC-barrel domain